LFDFFAPAPEPDFKRPSTAYLEYLILNHLPSTYNGVFETVRVTGRRLVSIAEVHAIVARAHLAQSEPEMTRNRFGLLERHGALMPCRYRSLAIPPLSRFAPHAGFVTQRQIFVRRCHCGLGVGCSRPWRLLQVRTKPGSVATRLG